MYSIHHFDGSVTEERTLPTTPPDAVLYAAGGTPRQHLVPVPGTAHRRWRHVSRAVALERKPPGRPSRGPLVTLHTQIPPTIKQRLAAEAQARHESVSRWLSEILRQRYQRKPLPGDDAQ